MTDEMKPIEVYETAGLSLGATKFEYTLGIGTLELFDGARLIDSFDCDDTAMIIDWLSKISDRQA